MRPKITFTGQVDVPLRKPYGVYRRRKGATLWRSIWQGHSGKQSVEVFSLQSTDVEAVLVRRDGKDMALVVRTDD